MMNTLIDSTSFHAVDRREKQIIKDMNDQIQDIQTEESTAKCNHK
jgi:hypothetical protein